VHNVLGLPSAIDPAAARYDDYIGQFGVKL